MMNERV
jgi:hypothetical protein